jgi:hypothetical protein
MRTLFIRKCFLQLFSNYILAFGSFWPKNIGTKAAHKMFVKMTTGVKFTKILQAAFSYKRSKEFFLQYFRPYSLCL